MKRKRAKSTLKFKKETVTHLTPEMLDRVQGGTGRGPESEEEPRSNLQFTTCYPTL